MEHGVPVFVGELVGRVSSLDTAAVEEDVDPFLLGEDGGQDGGQGVAGGEVGGVDCAFAAEGLDRFRGSGGCRVALEQDDICAGFGEGDGHGCADAPGSACNYGGLAI